MNIVKNRYAAASQAEEKAANARVKWQSFGLVVGGLILATIISALQLEQRHVCRIAADNADFNRYGLTQVIKDALGK
ncbi:MAG TPA: hypothetical protein VGP13_01150 [Candidatus Paceibacterota bacterium]|jgi:hypothetical protein|nr:hypothetical protein [Candidatus Paceibacterota bacterium]